LLSRLLVRYGSCLTGFLTPSPTVPTQVLERPGNLVIHVIASSIWAQQEHHSSDLRCPHVIIHLCHRRLWSRDQGLTRAGDNGVPVASTGRRPTRVRLFTTSKAVFRPFRGGTITWFKPKNDKADSSNPTTDPNRSSTETHQQPTAVASPQTTLGRRRK